MNLEQVHACYPQDHPLRRFAGLATHVTEHPSILSVDLGAEVQDALTRIELWVRTRPGDTSLSAVLEGFGARVAEITGYVFGGLLPTRWPTQSSAPSDGYVLIFAGPSHWQRPRA